MFQKINIWKRNGFLLKYTEDIRTPTLMNIIGRQMYFTKMKQGSISVETKVSELQKSGVKFHRTDLSSK